MLKKIIIFQFFIATILANDSLAPNECLEVGKSLKSSNKCFTLTMQEDGNLVLYKKTSKVPIWHTHTDKSCTNKACMQADGNFVTYDCNDAPTWASRTQDHEGSSLILQNDGNLVIYAWHSTRSIWASGTTTSCY